MQRACAQAETFWSQRSSPLFCLHWAPGCTSPQDHSAHSLHQYTSTDASSTNLMIRFFSWLEAQLCVSSVKGNTLRQNQCHCDYIGDVISYVNRLSAGKSTTQQQVAVFRQGRGSSSISLWRMITLNTELKSIHTSGICNFIFQTGEYCV